MTGPPSPPPPPNAYLNSSKFYNILSWLSGMYCLSLNITKHSSPWHILSQETICDCEVTLCFCSLLYWFIQALVKNHVSGINYLDVYFRGGIFPLPSLPATLGVEGAGVVEKLGPGVDSLAVGDHVAYFHVGSGELRFYL